jgi:hypothetical protein
MQNFETKIPLALLVPHTPFNHNKVGDKMEKVKDKGGRFLPAMIYTEEGRGVQPCKLNLILARCLHPMKVSPAILATKCSNGCPGNNSG